MKISARFWLALFCLLLISAIIFAFIKWQHTLEAQKQERTLQLVTKRLQERLETDFSVGAIKVDGVALVAVSDKHFNGSATAHILVDHSAPLNFTADIDGNTSVLTIEDTAIQKIRSVLSSELSPLFDEQSSAILQERYRPLFPKELTRDKDRFADYLKNGQSTLGSPEYIMGTGCRYDECLTDSAAWVIEKNTGHISALILHTNMDRDKNGQLIICVDMYGRPAGRSDMPSPLQRWLDRKTAEIGNLPPDALTFWNFFQHARPKGPFKEKC